MKRTCDTPCSCAENNNVIRLQKQETISNFLKTFIMNMLKEIADLPTSSILRDIKSVLIASA